MTNGASASRGVTAMRIMLRLWITTKTPGEMTMKPSKRLDPIHPGEILLEDFMKPLGISTNKLARDLDVPPNRISAIVNGTRSITADTVLRLGTYFRVSPETWLGLQTDYDLRLIRQRDGDQIVRSVRTRPAA
jgi:addiction module HigA family antidote